MCCGIPLSCAAMPLIDKLAWLTHADRERFSLVARNIIDWLRAQQFL